MQNERFRPHYGSMRIDASARLLPIFEFPPADAPRMLGTVEAVERELLRDGFLKKPSGKLAVSKVSNSIRRIRLLEAA